MYSTVNIPYTAMLGVISGDPVERADAATSKFIGAYAAGIIVSAAALPFVTRFGQGNAAKGWQMTLIVFGIAAVIFFLITFLSTKERIQPIAKEKTSVKNDLKDLSKNIPWIFLFIVTILFILFVCIRLSITHIISSITSENRSARGWRTFLTSFIRIVNPLKGLFGRPETALFEVTHKFGLDVLTSAFNTVGQVTSLLGLAIIPV